MQPKNLKLHIPELCWLNIFVNPQTRPKTTVRDDSHVRIDSINRTSSPLHPINDIPQSNSGIASN